MSSGDESATEKQPRAGWKKRRLQGACDVCRRKKSDSGTMPDGHCTNCRSFGSPCTHLEPPKKRGPKSNYVTKLERRILQLEETLRAYQDKKVPDADSPQQPRLSADDEETDKEPDLDYIEVMNSISKLSLHGVDGRYFGPSSNLSFMNHAFMKIHGGKQPPASFSVKREHWRNWLLHPWEEDAALAHPNLAFPPPDLLISLISLYFTHFHPFLPIFHQPSFKHAVASGLHLHDVRFGNVLLLVCAIASRASNDPRVILDCQTHHSSGWKFYQQVRTMPRGLFEKPSLFDLQHCCLSSEFLMGTSSPQSSWTMTGLGIRYAVEMGIHRHRPGPPTADSELKKRVFWGLVIMDRHLSFYHGRPSVLQHEDFDLELPIACDDEHWDTFKQPEGKPSIVDYLVCHIKLCQIMAKALRAIYSIRIPKNNGVELLAHIDSSLNLWHGQIPQHLTWDPQRENLLFFDQSAALHGIWYNVQIQIHRPFVRHAELGSQSMAICRTAARSCSHLLDVQRERNRLMIFGFAAQMSAFAAGLVLVLTIWANGRNGWRSEKEREDTERCLRALRVTERRCNISGRLIDVLQTLLDEVSLESEKCVVPTHRSTEQDELDIALPPSVGHRTQYHGQADIFLGQHQQYAPPVSSYWMPQEDIEIHPAVNAYTQSTVASLPTKDSGWTNTPTSFNWADWGQYASNMPQS